MKEINSHIQTEYLNASYSTSLSELKNVIDNYLSEKSYNKIETNNNIIGYVKTVSYPYKLFSNRSEMNTYEKIQTFVYIKIITINDSTYKIEIEDNTKNQPSQITNRRLSDTKHAFNDEHLFKHLYHQFIGLKLTLPKKLATKVNSYNLKQSKEKKKIDISGFMLSD